MKIAFASDLLVGQSIEQISHGLDAAGVEVEEAAGQAFGEPEGSIGLFEFVEAGARLRGGGGGAETGDSEPDEEGGHLAEPIHADENRRSRAGRQAGIRRDRAANRILSISGLLPGRPEAINRNRNNSYLTK